MTDEQELLAKFLEFADADYVPNSLFDRARTLLSASKPAVAPSDAINVLAERLKPIRAQYSLTYAPVCELSVPEIDAIIALAASPAAPAQSGDAAGFRGPAKFTPEEIADGNRGIRWITAKGVYGRPSDHDMREYLDRTPDMLGCTCNKCKSFYAASPAAPAQSAVANASSVVLDERTAFETQFERTIGYKPKRYGTFNYEGDNAKSLWKWWQWAWQAARAASPQPVVQTDEDS